MYRVLDLFVTHNRVSEKDGPVRGPLDLISQNSHTAYFCNINHRDVKLHVQMHIWIEPQTLGKHCITVSCHLP